eukprot:681962-Prymnesium_polylepis.1
MALGLGSAGRRPGLKLEVPVEGRDSSPQSGTGCGLVKGYFTEGRSLGTVVSSMSACVIGVVSHT